MHQNPLNLLYSRNRKEIKSSAKKLKKSIYLPFPKIQKEVNNFMKGYFDIINPYYIQNLYRGRKWEKEENPLHVNELLCPPINKINTFGRLNAPGQQILYLSETPQTIYKEIRANVGDEVILLRLIPRIKSSILKVSSFVRDYESYNPLALDLIREEALKVVGNELELKKVIEIRNQVADILQTEVNSYNQNVYKLTSALSKHIFRDSMDGVIYSSIQTEKTFYNIALKPETLHSHLIGHTVVRVKLKSLDVVNHKVQVIQNGVVSDDGTLIWDDSTSFEFPIISMKDRL